MRIGRPTICIDAELAEVKNMMLRSPIKKFEEILFQISYGNFQKATNKLKFRSYHIRSVSELVYMDKEKRLGYCKWF